MTAVVAPFPQARSRRKAQPRNWIELAAFAASVFLILTYSQGWVSLLSGGAEQSPESALIRTLYLPAYGMAVGLLALRPLESVGGLVRQPLLLLVLGIAWASLFWSVAPDQTSRRIFALVFTTLSGVVLATRYDWPKLAEAMATAFAILAVVSLFVCLFVPSVGRMQTLFPGAWCGLWAEKNAFGDNQALGASIASAAAMLNPRRRKLWWGVTALCVFLVLMSTSKTSLVAVMLAAGATGLVWTVRRGPAAGVAATWAALVGVGLVASIALFASHILFGLLGKDATLTGRTQIWSAVMRQIQARPWEGYGYAAIWDETDRWGPLAWIIHDAGFRPHHAHNSWLEQWLSLGLPGLIAWAGFYLQTLIANVFAIYTRAGAYLALPFFVIYSLTTLTESIAVVYNDMRWVIFVALAVRLALPDAKTAPAATAAQAARRNQPRQKSQ
ncbi:MAG TPA: O-antigen ligase [Caulobacteraceae bacterium]